MSGGIDSSVAAALLKRADFDVIGVFMKFWSGKIKGPKERCCSPEAENRARKVASILKIPFYVFNFEKEFKRKIVDYFLKEYKAGSTPNPCVVCNKEIKFGLLLAKALALGADYVASGHYARTNLTQAFLKRPTTANKIKEIKLLKAKDKNKDQSYFLWMLNQKQLKRILFPIGDYTKDKVRALAKKNKLPVLNVPESQEVCFIQTTINDFLKKHLKGKPGKIVNEKGRAIGRHQGLHFFTIGQRKGIRLASGPYFVLSKDLKRNFLVVTKNEKDLYKKELICKNVNWISGKEPRLPLKVKAKIRYHQKLASAVVTKTLDAKRYTLKFDRPQRAITPGQSVAFYKREEVLGGGIICQNKK